MNRTFTSGSLDRNTNHLIDFNQSVMSEKNDVNYDGQWNETVLNGTFGDRYETGQTDNGFAQNVSRRRTRAKPKFFHPAADYDMKSQTIKEEKSYYYEADDVSFDEVASDVTLLRCSERLKALPTESSSGSEKRSKQRWGEPPMPVTFYNKDTGPYTVI